MLNPFPIQFLALFAYFLLRVCVGWICISLGLRHLRFTRDLRHSTAPIWPIPASLIYTLVLSELTLGLMFIVGWYTQYAALGGIALATIMLIWHKRCTPIGIPPRIFYVLFLGTAVSLFITGAGAFAFDLPI